MTSIHSHSRGAYNHPEMVAYFAAEDAAQDLHAFERELIGRHLPPGGTVCLLGCNVGRGARELERRGHALVGVDRAEETLLESQKRFPGGRFRRCAGEGANLPFPDGSFEAVILFGFLNDIPLGIVKEGEVREDVKILRECRRILKKDGRLLAWAFGRPKLRAWPLFLLSALVRKGEPYPLRRRRFLKRFGHLWTIGRGSLLNRWGRGSCRLGPGDLVWSFPSPTFIHAYGRAELTGALEAAGLRVRECRVAEEPFGPGYQFPNLYYCVAADRS